MSIGDDDDYRPAGAEARYGGGEKRPRLANVLQHVVEDYGISRQLAGERLASNVQSVALAELAIADTQIKAYVLEAIPLERSAQITTPAPDLDDTGLGANESQQESPNLEMSAALPPNEGFDIRLVGRLARRVDDVHEPAAGACH